MVCQDTGTSVYTLRIGNLYAEGIGEAKRRLAGDRG